MRYNGQLICDGYFSMTSSKVGRKKCHHQATMEGENFVLCDRCARSKASNDPRFSLGFSIPDELDLADASYAPAPRYHYGWWPAVNL